MVWTLLLPLLSATLLHQALGVDVSVTTKKGTITGLNVPANTDTTNIAYDAFLGIPYGDKPDRFQLAKARTAWTTALTTQADGPPCPQPNLSVDYSEDCLYLNVYTPAGASASASTTSDKLPVMVFIPGEGFIYSFTSSKVYRPDFLISGGVILVTVNYRVGATGFLSLNSKVAPGNLGLHDTLLALQWVKDEISAFGGDSSKVTLFGQSAGSVITHFHYLSSLSTGLFQRAISQSGSALAPWGYVKGTEARSRAIQLARKLNCDTSKSDTDILSCLQKADVKYILGNQSIALSDYDTIAGRDFPFVPVLDTNITAEKPFFSDSLDTLIKAAVTRAKPLISGFTADEGIVVFSKDSYKKAEANLVAFIAVEARNGDDKINSIKKRYFNQSSETLNKVAGLVSLYTDYLYANPAVQVSRAFAEFTYGYVFTYDGTWFKPTASNQFYQFKMQGVDHGEDVDYLFYNSQSLDTCAANVPNVKMKDNMVKWWTTFAKTGVPDSSWLTIAKGGYYVIDSQTSFKSVTVFESQYYDFWASIQKSSSSAHITSITLLTLFLSLGATFKTLYL